MQSKNYKKLAALVIKFILAGNFIFKFSNKAEFPVLFQNIFKGGITGNLSSVRTVSKRKKWGN